MQPYRPQYSGFLSLDTGSYMERNCAQARNWRMDRTRGVKTDQDMSCGRPTDKLETSPAQDNPRLHVVDNHVGVSASMKTLAAECNCNSLSQQGAQTIF